MRYLLLLVLLALPLRTMTAGCPPSGGNGQTLTFLTKLLDEDPAAVRLAAAAEGVSVEAFRARLVKAEHAVEGQARTTAQAQGLDARSSDRYVAARVAAFRATELRRLLNASPALRAHLSPRLHTMGVSAPTCAQGARRDLDWARIAALLSALGLVVGYAATRFRSPINA